MSRNESKSSSNFSKPAMSQNRFARQMNNDSYAMDSPDVGHRKANNKVGVQLAPLGQQAQNMTGAGRASMMSIKGMEHDQEGTESHPILRVHNYKKPTLDKLHSKQNNNINFTVDDMGPGQQY